MNRRLKTDCATVLAGATGRNVHVLFSVRHAAWSFQRTAGKIGAVPEVKLIFSTGTQNIRNDKILKKLRLINEQSMAQGHKHVHADASIDF